MCGCDGNLFIGEVPGAAVNDAIFLSGGVRDGVGELLIESVGDVVIAGEDGVFELDGGVCGWLGVSV